MPKTVLRPAGLPEGRYPFSQLVEANGFVFPVDPPTRATVAVSRLALGARCEIEVIAARQGTAAARPGTVPRYETLAALGTDGSGRDRLRHGTLDGPQ